MKLYYTPGACSLGIHILLQEIGKPFDLEKVDLMNGAQFQPPFVTFNPKSKVPALQRDDGSILTEFPAIAFYLARTNPQKNLLPASIEGETRALELLDYLIATVHMRGFTRVFRPINFAPSEADAGKVREAGRDIVLKAFNLLEPVLGSQDYILGEFSVVDAALFFLEYWALNHLKLPIPENFAAHQARLRGRPAVQQALAAEGLS